MPLNKQKGNMYPWVTHTWNPIRGKCPHDCSYCYMKRIPNVGELRFVEKEMNTNLGEGNTVFVGSSTDMWARIVPLEWIKKVLNHTRKYQRNVYLFQTKNPCRFSDFYNIWGDTDTNICKLFPRKKILGTTLETNRCITAFGSEITKAPGIRCRITEMCELYKYWFKTMISIEPIMDFDIDIFVDLLQQVHPEFVSIGADSGHNNLPEPPAWKVKELIEELKQFTEVKIKDNLKRILDSG